MTTQTEHPAAPAGTGARSPDLGFTLIELLMVIVILGVLATVVVFAVGGITNRGEVSALDADEKTLVTAAEAYFATNGTYTSEAGLVGAGLLRDQSELHDLSLAIDSSNYTIVPAGSGGGGGGGGGNGGVSPQTIGAFDAIVYNQGGTPVVAVFSRNNMSASLTSKVGTYPGEIIWFNDPDLDTAAEMTQALGTVSQDTVFADDGDAGWDAGSAANAFGGSGTLADGWRFTGDVAGLVDFGDPQIGTIDSTYSLPGYADQTVSTYGNGPLQVALFPANGSDVAAFGAFVTNGVSIRGVTLNLMPLPGAFTNPVPIFDPADYAIDAVPAFGYTFVGDFGGTFLADLETANGAPGGIWSEWVNGIDELDGLALAQTVVNL